MLKCKKGRLKEGVFMDDKTGGTPNPLNPATPGTAPSAVPKPAASAMPNIAPKPIARSAGRTVRTVRPARPIRPAVRTAPSSTAAPVPETDIEISAMETEELQPNGDTAVLSESLVESLDPNGRTMEQSSGETTEKKKSKKGLIALIIALILVIGGGIAAVIIVMNLNRPNAVAAAMQKIMSGNAPSNVAIDGDIDLHINDENSPISRINIDLDSDITFGSMINTSSAVLTITTSDQKDYSIEFEELYSANGDLFFKISDPGKALSNSNLLELLVDSFSSGTTQTNCDENGVNCEPVPVDCKTEDGCDATKLEDITAEIEPNTGDDVPESTSAVVTGLISLIDANDGLMIRISTDELSNTVNSTESQNSAGCIANLVSDLNKNTASAADLYGKYPFITATTDNVLIQKKQHTVYRVGINNQNFANYVNNISNPDIAGDIFACLNLEDSAVITTEDVDKITSKMPTVYAEVNNDNNFSRLYIESDIPGGVMTMTADFEFNYPTSVNVSEPVEYMDFSELIEKLTNNLFEEGTTVEVNETPTE